MSQPSSFVFFFEKTKRQERINANGVVVVTWCFQTVTHPAFLFLHKLFFTDRVKSILSNLIDYLTPVSLAYWFMDDGGRQDYVGYGLQLHTQGFTNVEVEILCNILRTKFNLDVWMKRNKGKPIIAISGHSYDKFFNLVNAFIVKSMRRKFPKGARSSWNTKT